MNDHVDADVVVAGAGPAGVAAAVALVKQVGPGARPPRVLCLDRAQFPRPKPCGGGLTGHAAAAMAALGLELRVPSVPCHHGRLVHGRLSSRVALRNPVHVVRREDFDADLVAQARALGVAVNEGEGMASFEVDRERRLVHLRTSAGRGLRCRVLVGADGAGSLVRRRLADQAAGGRTRAPRRPLRLARLELPAPRPLPPAMVYDFTPFAEGLRGYVWLFPVPGGRLNVGVMHDAAARDLGGRALDELLGRALARHGVSLPAPARGWPAWGYHPDAPVAGPHLLCVGDAAGIDGLTGEGIAVGLAHGPLAAQAITRALATGDFHFADYPATIRRALVGRELALDRALAALLYGTTDPRPWLALVMGDPQVQSLYASRVSGDQVLADRKPALVAALARHFFLAHRRISLLDASVAQLPSPPSAPGLARRRV